MEELDLGFCLKVIFILATKQSTVDNRVNSRDHHQHVLNLAGSLGMELPILGQLTELNKIQSI
jgi:hypothetical protein